MISSRTLATVVVIVLLAAAVAAAIVYLVKNRGRGCCGDCSKCAMKRGECGYDCEGGDKK